MNERIHPPSGLTRCVVCGDPADYCHGHGPIGDPRGAQIERQHKCGNHVDCHPHGCTVAHAALRARHPSSGGAIMRAVQEMRDDPMSGIDLTRRFSGTEEPEVE